MIIKTNFCLAEPPPAPFPIECHVLFEWPLSLAPNQIGNFLPNILPPNFQTERYKTEPDKCIFYSFFDGFGSRYKVTGTSFIALKRRKAKKSGFMKGFKIPDTQRSVMNQVRKMLHTFSDKIIFKRSRKSIRLFEVTIL